MKKVLFVATVVKTHIMEFHLPYLKLFKDLGWETFVAAKMIMKITMIVRFHFVTIIMTFLSTGFL